MFKSDGVIKYLDKVGSDLDPGNVNDDRVRRFAGLGRSGVVNGDGPEPVHYPVPDSLKNNLI